MTEIYVVVPMLFTDDEDEAERFSQYCKDGYNAYATLDLAVQDVRRVQEDLSASGCLTIRFRPWQEPEVIGYDGYIPGKSIKAWYTAHNEFLRAVDTAREWIAKHYTLEYEATETV